jgi:hypothetical protein
LKFFSETLSLKPAAPIPKDAIETADFETAELNWARQSEQNASSRSSFNCSKNALQERTIKATKSAAATANQGPIGRPGARIARNPARISQCSPADGSMVRRLETITSSNARCFTNHSINADRFHAYACTLSGAKTDQAAQNIIQRR